MNTRTKEGNNILLNKLYNNKSNCCGCSSCVQRCPRKCITIKSDSEGFLYPNINEIECIHCGLCEKVCPMTVPPLESNTLSTFAVKNPNIQERKKSSSGGVFISLAKQIIAEKGVVFGAVFDKEWTVKHTYAENIEAVYPMMASKYLQSKIGNCYKKAELFLKQNRKVLFVGTPCQIKGLYQFLQKKYTNLLTVDFLCHGVPSPGIWKQYLRESIAPYTFADIASISFRDKSTGWDNYSIRILGIDGKSLLYQYANTNSFMKGFLNDIYLRPACYQCRFKNGKSNSDITIGDLWGANKISPHFYDTLGVGLVALHSKKGEEIFQSLQLDKTFISEDEAKRYNAGFNNNIQPHKKRSTFFKLVQRDMKVSEAVDKCLTISFQKRWKQKIKHLMKMLKQSTNKFYTK